MASYNDKRKLDIGNFKIANGKILHFTTVLQTKFIKLTSVQSVLRDQGVDDGDFLDSVNFLSEEGYITLRQLGSHLPATLADIDYRDIEMKLANKGKRVLCGDIKDNLVELERGG